MNKFDARYRDFKYNACGRERGRQGHRGFWGRPLGDGQKASESILSESSSGEECVFLSLLCDRPAFRNRMMALGLMPGTKLRILEGGRGRPFLVEIRGGKFMLDAGSAAMIAVKRLPARPEGDAQ